MTTTDFGIEPTDLLRRILSELETMMDPADGPIDEIARRLDLADQIQSVLSDLLLGLQMEIAERMETDSQVIAGIGQFTRRAKESSTWKDESSRERMFEDAKRAIAQRLARDPQTGEIIQPLAQIAKETFDLIEASFSLGAQPKTAFRKTLGLQPDEYRIRSTSGYSVKIDRGITDLNYDPTGPIPFPKRRTEEKEPF